MATKKPFFSIIIPALNEEKYLPHLLDDLTKQTFRDFEVILVDGNSSDATVAKAKSFAKSLPHLTILTSPKRHVCVQRNLGAKKAIADTLIFMDADNRLPLYFLQGIKYRLESTPSDICTVWTKPDNSNPANDIISFGINLGLEIQNNITPRFILESMIIIRKLAFIKIGGFDTNSDYAEGIPFISQANSASFMIKIFRDPTYQYSFRRFRKFGTIHTLKTYTQLGISNFLGEKYKNKKAQELYPMLGGSLFTTSNKAKNKFLQHISKLLQDF